MEQKPALQERKRWPMFEPINEATIQALKTKISENLGFDFSELRVTIARPGDHLFDYHEAQLKLYLKSGSFKNYKKLLEKYNFFPSLTVSPDDTLFLRDMARKEGVILDDTFQGFVYNIGYARIMYVAIREDKVMEMALKYKAKEQDKIELKNIESAKMYLRNLSEKYFYHEIGHTVFGLLISESDRTVWSDLVKRSDELKARVVEIQKDKHPSVESIPVAEEAFADLLVEVGSLDQKNRLGDFPEAIELMRRILLKNGFHLPRG